MILHTIHLFSSVWNQQSSMIQTPYQLLLYKVFSFLFFHWKTDNLSWPFLDYVHPERFGVLYWPSKSQKSENKGPLRPSTFSQFACLLAVPHLHPFVVADHLFVSSLNSDIKSLDAELLCTDEHSATTAAKVLASWLQYKSKRKWEWLETGCSYYCVSLALSSVSLR